MRNFSHLTLLVTGAAALLGAAGCSSPAEGDNPNSVPSFNNPGQGGTTGIPNVNGQGGTTGIPNVGTGGSSTGEGQAGTTFIPGQGGSTNGAGGAGGPIVDIPPTAPPGGYFEVGEWHGYAWTGTDDQNLSTVQPPTFEGLPSTDPFCFNGVVGNDPPSSPTANDGYQGVALLGFNIAQDLFGPAEGVEAPVLEVVPTAAGVAVNFTRNATPAGTTAAPLLRIQLQNNAGQFWCADLPTVSGQGFVSYTQAAAAAPFFRTNCWEAVTSPTSVAYARQPISAVVLTVPGDAVQDFAFDVCVAGFADGNSAADAPASIGLPEGVLTGVLVTEAAKAKVIADGEEYIINNNAWGVNSGDGTQRLRFTNNSFEILQQSAGPGGDSSPASFPSIYIGANGATSGVNGGTTSATDNLPIQVSAIQSIPTTFNHNATNGNNDYNATYDVWFAPNDPPGEYGTAQAAFLMVWTYKPTGRVAIGQRRAQPVNVDGRDWFLYVGPRGGGGPDANLPVISYVNEGASIQNYSFDLNVFIEHAISQNVGLTANMFLTDVFAGFEIWNGGQGLRVNEFSAVVNP